MESVVIGFYYNVIIAWSFFYLFNSFFNPLPWSVCPIEQASVNEFEDIPNRLLSVPSPTRQHSSFIVLLSTPQTLLLATMHKTFTSPWWSLSCSLVLPLLDDLQGIQSSGKAMYVTATFPYITLTIFLIYGLTLDGALDGLAYLFTPDYDVLATAAVWLDAGTQVFFSMSLAVGGIIAFSSYNDKVYLRFLFFL